MSRACTVCSHERREEIDRALVSGSSNLSLSSLFDVSEASLRRHGGPDKWRPSCEEPRNLKLLRGCYFVCALEKICRSSVAFIRWHAL